MTVQRKTVTIKFPSSLSIMLSWKRAGPKYCLFPLLVLLECNCFTMSCECLLCNVNQLYVTCVPFLESFSPAPPSHCSRSSQKAEPSSCCLCSSMPQAVCFIHVHVYMSVLLSQFVPPSPSRSLFMSPFSTSASISACK